MLLSGVVSEFLKRVIMPNRWRYLIVIAACLVYVFSQTIFGPKWYRAEATLALKNRPGRAHYSLTRTKVNPLPVFFEEEPIEEQYELVPMIYSVNMANRVLGDEFEEIYESGDYTDLSEFYYRFLSQLGFEYDGDRNIIHLSYIYKDPEQAAKFCNRFADSLEEFMQEIVERSYVSPMLRRRLVIASERADEAEAELHRIAEAYGVPDLMIQPLEWGEAYYEALVRAMYSEVRLQSAIIALRQVRENRERRNLLTEPAGAPDRTIIQDIVLSGLRFRLSMLSTAIALSDEILPEDSGTRLKLTSESEFIREYLEHWYRQGLDVETRTLTMRLQVFMAENYLYKQRAGATYDKLAQLPRLEKEIRPSLRSANLQRAVAFTLDKMASLMEIAEGYGIDPIRLIDRAVPPEKPQQPAWKMLGYLLPTALFMSTLWFALVTRMVGAATRTASSDPVPVEDTT